MPTFATPHPVSATVELALGDVRITASERADTVVDVRPSDAANEADVKAAEATHVDYANEKLVVKAPKTRPLLGARNNTGSIDVTIEVPAGSHLDGSGQMADFHADGRLGDCRVRTGLGRVELDWAGALHVKNGAGDVTVDRTTGHAEIVVGSGDVRLRELDGTAVIRNANGDTWVGTAGGDTRVKSANGSIVVDRANASLAAKSANGDVRVAEAAHGSVVVETQIGDLEVGIREGTAAWLDVKAVAGHVRNELDSADAPPATSTDRVEVRARTSVGDVVIRRA
jgi:DUF4097 and DUF4098 domain-containing protein YvlB